MSKRTNVVVTLYAAVLLVGPLVLWLMGWRAPNIENRQLTDFPSTEAVSLVQDGWYQQASSYFEDRLPLRDRAVRADAWIDYELAGDSPVDTVTLGDDGWLFITSDFAFPCSASVDPEGVAKTMTVIAKLIDESGREPVIYVAPNKSSVYPEHAGAIGDLQCAVDSRETIRSELDRRATPGYVDGWEHLEAVKAVSDEPIYNPYDTHWNPAVGPHVVEFLLEAMQVDLWDPADVSTLGLQPYEAELPAVMGLPFDQLLDTPVILRSGISVFRLGSSGDFGPDFYAAGPERLADAETVTMFHDSFGFWLAPGLRQYIQSSTFVDWRAIVDDPDRGASTFARHVGASDRVIIESVERLLYRRFTREFVDYPAALAAALLDDLPSTEVELAAYTGDVRRLRSDPGSFATYLVVEFVGNPTGMIEATLNDRPADRLLPQSGIPRVAWDISRARQLDLGEDAPEIASIRLVVIDHGGDQ